MRSRRLLTVIGALLLCAPLAACSANSGGGSDGGGLSMGGSPPYAADRGMTSENWAGDGAAPEMAATSPSSISTERSVIRTGELSIEVDDARQAGAQLEEIAAGLGGRVDEKSVSGTDGSRAYLSIRVPSERFDEAFTAFGEVGNVINENRSASDVTMHHVDLQARTAALEASIERLTALMTDAATTGELIEAESALAQRQAELDGLRAQLNRLESQIDESTIWVHLQVKSALPGGGPSTFWEALGAGFESIGAFAAGAVIVLGVLLPWFALLAVIAAIIVLPILSRRRRRRASAPQGEAAPHPRNETPQETPAAP